ncbi:MAG: hypothetical protein HY314_10195 [Acidobacteria bacterium]|nr:hypothetical protein [Acidobacteriota bacterium]
MMRRRDYQLAVGFLLLVVGAAIAQEGGTWVIPKILNTNKMEWTPVQDLEEQGWLKKELAVEPKSGAEIRLFFIPPGWIDQTGVNERHFTDYREWAFTLFGDLPFCSYDHPADDKCHLTIDRKGTYLDRPRNNIHGTEGPKRTAELGLPVSKTGYFSLFWREKKGKINYVHWPPKEEYLKMDKSLFTQPRYVQTDEMDWQPHPTLKGWLIKPLTDDSETKVSILYMPAGGVDQPHLEKQTKVQYHEFRYVLWGEMPFWYYKSPDQQKPELAMLQGGYFVHLPPGAVVGADRQPTSRTGCSFLQIIRYDLK